MENIFHVIIISVVQGVTEFLPISSSAHLYLLSNLFGLEEMFLVVLILLLVCLENCVFPGIFEFFFSITTVFLDFDLASSMLLKVFFEFPDIDSFNFFFFHYPSFNLYKLCLLLTLLNYQLLV